ncbi:hypothetical protein GCM10010174_15420 [Kutzneria viridogrisea]|uniref:Thioredoxin domain-containing protein n=2 Tax=Kutzneria TaxID=43356 RepID=W5WIY3_9PSEU|nr:thioredoxin family protein [Kutzneria albida]AHI00833.1 hypothetical protein KALB_7475 [Kutzneria albida DSM 43870]MBA8926110.1 putative thioredoxin [Kutzneria viridogrisea]
MFGRRKFAALVVTGAAAAALLGGSVGTAAAAPADDTIVDVTSANYQQIVELSKSKPVVLDFTASWCHWCQVEKPYLQKFHDADKGKWVWAKVDVDQNKELSNKYNVDGIPDLIELKGGQEVGSRFQGFDKDQADNLRDWLNGL